MRRGSALRNMKRARLTLALLRPKRGASMAHTFIAEKPEFAEAIERVLDRAFGPGRYAKTSERVREAGAVLEPSLTRIALNEEGDVVGVCRIWRVEAGEPLYFLGPLAVDPSVQSGGVGLTLVHDAVAACRASGGNGVVLVGAERFFRPVGFTVVPAGKVSLPGPVDPARLLWLELRPGGLDKVHGELHGPKR
jgi:predicted N-acetyltransferase YhbS